MNGFFLINKKQNMTSHDVVNFIKRKFNFDKVGHTGILDPLAGGLLIILVNKATKLSFLFNDLDKTYTGNILFNYNYDTLDITGNLIETKNIILSEKEIKENIRFFNQKKYFQIPPMYSAIKVKGQKLYHLARKNVAISVPPREVFIYKFQMLGSLEENTINFEAQVSKGTYIRSLARDLANKINTFGVIKSLIRTKIGTYNLKEAHDLDTVMLDHFIDAKILFQDTQKIILNDYLIKLIKNGIMLDERQIITTEPFVVTDEQNNYIAYYEPIKKNKYIIKYLF
ncbi:tRNA pseudouridine(55) synthase TruB ['Camptotheca acuminata' phytoplasma]|uniref:tRNA pseudouridine(55) synthase TruB n=1 Tax='Camptotheca acuminata' phytoplasma TaxID=3239192 RepID=UPI00351A3755